MQRYFAKEYNDKIILRDSDIHHIKNVMRMKIDDRIEVVFDKKLYIRNSKKKEKQILPIKNTKRYNRMKKIKLIWMLLLL